MKFHAAVAEGKRYLYTLKLDREESRTLPAFFLIIEEGIQEGLPKHEALKRAVNWSWRASPFVSSWAKFLAKKFLLDLGCTEPQADRFMKDAK